MSSEPYSRAADVLPDGTATLYRTFRVKVQAPPVEPVRTAFDKMNVSAHRDTINKIALIFAVRTAQPPTHASGIVRSFPHNLRKVSSKEQLY